MCIRDRVEIDPQKGFDFHHVLRAFLNADPDVIMVNPIRDLKTAALCMEASLRGRMVLASFPAETITGTMEKCFDLGPVSYTHLTLPTNYSV